MTVEEFLEKENLPESISGGTLNYAMTEFAKFHLNNFSKQFDLSIWTKDDIIESYIEKHLK